MDNKMLEKLMAKKKDGKELPEEYKNAKMAMLQALHGEMSGMMAHDLKNGMNPEAHHVEIEGNSPAALKHGLATAESLVGSNEDGEEGDEHNPMYSGAAADEGAEEDMEGQQDHGMSNTADLGEEDEEKKSPGEADKEMIEAQIDHEATEGELTPEMIDEIIAELNEKKMKLSQK